MKTNWHKNPNGFHNWWLDSKECLLTTNSFLPWRTVCFGGVEQVNLRAYFAWIVNPWPTGDQPESPFLELGTFPNLQHAQRIVDAQFNPQNYI